MPLRSLSGADIERLSVALTYYGDKPYVSHTKSSLVAVKRRDVTSSIANAMPAQ